ncbi:hypothetical protein ACIRRA_41905 [Nocardia sp. NPDC101769]|uniref:hypothetical protein n=1 Tax=Nocardia sp. NPDC101769 TaxID=3364333 RepID=UPI003806A071
MTVIALAFILGLTAGSATMWFLPPDPRPYHPATDGWTVAAITSRIEHERPRHSHRSPHTRPAVPTRHNRPQRPFPPSGRMSPRP